MTRFDFLGDPRREAVLAFVASLRTGDRRIAAIAAASFVVALGAAMGGIALRTLEVDRAIAIDEAEHTRNLPAIARFRSMEKDVAMLGDLQSGIVAARRSARLRAREIVRMSDGLPNGVWLANLQAGSAEWRLVGEARDVASVSSALVAAQRDRRTASASLESVRRGIDGTVSYGIVVLRK